MELSIFDFFIQRTSTYRVLFLSIHRVGFNVKKKFQGTDIYKVILFFPIISKALIGTESKPTSS